MYEVSQKIMIIINLYPLEKNVNALVDRSLSKWVAGTGPVSQEKNGGTRDLSL